MIECWNCGSDQIVRTSMDGDYLSCETCGTTWIPTPGQPSVPQGGHPGLKAQWSDAAQRDLEADLAGWDKQNKSYAWAFVQWPPSWMGRW